MRSGGATRDEMAQIVATAAYSQLCGILWAVALLVALRVGMVVVPAATAAVTMTMAFSMALAVTAAAVMAVFMIVAMMVVLFLFTSAHLAAAATAMLSMMTFTVPAATVFFVHDSLLKDKRSYWHIPITALCFHYGHMSKTIFTSWQKCRRFLLVSFCVVPRPIGGKGLFWEKRPFPPDPPNPKNSTAFKVILPLGGEM